MINTQNIQQKLYFSLILFLLLFQSCFVPHKSFVATSYEPLTVKKKGDVEASASIRPFKFFKSNITYAASNCIAFRAGYSGFFGLDNFDASVLYFKNYSKIGFYVGGNYNYQHNIIIRDYSLSFFALPSRKFKYNCEYVSPGVVIGFSLYNDHHFILKTNYNIVNKYYYKYISDNNSGKNQSYIMFDNEILDYKIPDFLSFEPSYAFVT